MGEITGNGTAVTGLGGAAGYGETMLARGDDTVAQVNLGAVFEDGFTLGDTHFAANQLYISTDGLISFGMGVTGVAATASAIAAPFFAIFNGDVDTRLDGEGAESGAVWLDVDTVADCVTITWDHVGFYRRNATLTNTFQIQLFDRGNGGFDVVYRYQDISWTSGDLQDGWGGLDGVAALIGYRDGASGAGTLVSASGNQTAQLGLPDALGNTGVAGLWVFGFADTTAINGTSGADTLAGTTANDTMNGLGGDDVLMGSAGSDVLNGGIGTDTADYSTATAAVRIDLAAPLTNLGQATGDSFQLIERFVGSTYDDTLRGALATDALFGGNGADSLEGGAGQDTLDGGAGDDVILGGNGRDVLRGGGGIDRLDGGMGADTLYGDDGNDALSGQMGRDEVYGGVGNDDLRGGSGDDVLDGGMANDTLYGGTGADTFRHAGIGGQGSDWVMDFDNAEGDRLLFGIAGAVKSDFSVIFATTPGAGRPGIAEAYVTYLPMDRLCWILVDGGDEAAIFLQSSMNSFDLL